MVQSAEKGWRRLQRPYIQWSHACRCTDSNGLDGIYPIHWPVPLTL